VSFLLARFVVIFPKSLVPIKSSGQTGIKADFRLGLEENVVEQLSVINREEEYWMCDDPVKFNFKNIYAPKSQSSLTVEKEQEKSFKIFMKQHINKLVNGREYLLPELQDSDTESLGTFFHLYEEGTCISCLHAFMYLQPK